MTDAETIALGSTGELELSSYQDFCISFLALVIVTLSSWTCSLAQATQGQVTDDSNGSTKSGSITGRVVNESGQPLANAVVYVRAFASSAQPQVTATDGEGNFQVSGLDPRAYQVWAVLPAYSTAPRDPDSAKAAYFRVGDSATLELIKGGVITGTVTGSAGEPIVGVRVFAYMIRDGNGQPPRYATPFRVQATDDRGIYRIYGLSQGTYIVSAEGGNGYDDFGGAEYQSHAPTYAPSATRDNAGEIIVRSGEETTGVDIRYRGDPGHTVSGFASDPNETAKLSGIQIRMTSTVNGMSQWSRWSYQPPDSRGFMISGIADGDYDLTAEIYSPGGDLSLSEARRISVRGADVTGISLSLTPMASIAGRVVLEDSKLPECKGKRRPLFEETLISAWHNEKSAAKDKPQFIWALGSPTIPDRQGDFKLRNMAPAPYRFNIRFFAKYWYLQSISLSSSITPLVGRTTTNRSTDAARNWTTVKSGARVSGLTISLAEGAASLHGRIKTAENQRLPVKLFVYLVPADREKAEDVLRFFASRVFPDGSFALDNLPPGRYLAIAKSVSENESNVLSKLRLPDETEARGKLLKEGEAAKTQIELKPCQNVTNYSLPITVP